MIAAMTDAGFIIVAIGLFVPIGLVVDWIVKTRRSYGIGEDQ